MALFGSAWTIDSPQSLLLLTQSIDNSEIKHCAYPEFLLPLGSRSLCTVLRVLSDVVSVRGQAANAEETEGLLRTLLDQTVGRRLFY